MERLFDGVGPERTAGLRFRPRHLAVASGRGESTAIGARLDDWMRMQMQMENGSSGARLPAADSSRRFRLMRVEIRAEFEEAGEKFEVPWQDPGKGLQFLDLRANPAAVEKVEAARQHRPLANFLSAVNSADSLFASVRAQTGLEQRSGDAEACLFSTRVVVAFADPSMNLEREIYTGLLEKLKGLLTKGGGSEALRVELALHPCRYNEVSRWGTCLAILLEASGSTDEQAVLRWGLGLAHVQQALLFSSRVLRQERAQRS